METPEPEETNSGLGAKPFIGLVAVVLLFGLSIGGAYALGVTMGRGDDSADAGTTMRPLIATQQEATGATNVTVTDGPIITEDIARRMDSGEMTQAELEDLRRQFVQQSNRPGWQTTGARQEFGFGAGAGPGAALATWLTGTIESIEGDVITVSTPGGATRARVGDETVIVLNSAGALSDLTVGETVTVIGDSSEDGTVDAASIVTVPIPPDTE